jgi:Protein of unknown function (DUF1616)
LAQQRSPTISQIREFIIEVVNTKNLETTIELVKLVKQKYSIPEEDIVAILLQLEDENEIHFNKKTSQIPKTLSSYMFSYNSIWFWTTIVISTATAFSVFTIPENTYHLTFIRQILGAIFVGFLPGYVFIKTLYPSKVPIPTSSENLDTIERIAFSLVLSIVFTAIVGLILNYTPWGIRLMPITLSLLALTMVFASTGLIREYQATGKLQNWW